MDIEGSSQGGWSEWRFLELWRIMSLPGLRLDKDFFPPVKFSFFQFFFAFLHFSALFVLLGVPPSSIPL